MEVPCNCETISHIWGFGGLVVGAILGMIVISLFVLYVGPALRRLSQEDGEFLSEEALKRIRRDH